MDRMQQIADRRDGALGRAAVNSWPLVVVLGTLLTAVAFAVVVLQGV
jgi:hypothetical protein